jgi:exodeoxyribonuclease V
VVGAEEPQVSAASIIKIEKPDEEEPFIPSPPRWARPSCTARR